MKFAHIADCHIGGWREPKLRNIGVIAFERAIDTCIEKNVDFVVIAGDLFNTSLPSIEHLKPVVAKLKGLKDKSIPLYIIAGSHDFSPSGKTMLDVLENAGLVINVARGEEVDGKLRLLFTVDPKTGVKITGLLGKKGGLEKNYYECLMKDELECEKGEKIFLFHSLLSELKPKELEHCDSQALSLLPKNFSYYAGGHPHFVKDVSIEGYGKIAYPGPLFPNNFKELEELSCGGFYIIDDGRIKFEQIQVFNVFAIKILSDHRTPLDITNEILEKIRGQAFNDTIVTIRVSGSLESGKTSDVDFKTIFDRLYEKSAYFVMKNTNGLIAREFEEVKIDARDVEDVEEKLISENIGQVKVEGMNDESAMTKHLMKAFSMAKDEGEKVFDFERRIKDEAGKILELI
ncbi:MAG TPA: exonuclease SbcCD subunit D [Candidatus Nanoarchaeia archaeon]|nr:exonuclease SbcCD subunit D [Candidatus Nanoarchaeia archaeon]